MIPQSHSHFSIRILNMQIKLNPNLIPSLEQLHACRLGDSLLFLLHNGIMQLNWLLELTRETWMVARLRVPIVDFQALHFRFLIAGLSFQTYHDRFL